MTRATAEALIERLADKTLRFGCVLRSYNLNLGHPEHVYCGPSLVNDDCYIAKLKDGVCTHMSNTGIGQEVSVVGHPIMLTDVLEKLLRREEQRAELKGLDWVLWPHQLSHTEMDNLEEYHSGFIEELSDKWYDCGITKSLQTILQEAEWHNAPRKAPEGHVVLADMPEQMKGPAAELFEYLLSLFPET